MTDKERRTRAVADFIDPPFVRCVTRKVPWATEQAAQREADRLNAKSDGYGINYPFKCSSCGKWHNGRPYKGKTVH